MTRGVKTGSLTASDLKKRLGIGDKDENGNLYTKKDLLVKAIKAGKVSESEVDLSTPTRNSVIKCYLHSIVDSSTKGLEYRNAIEQYVLTASQLYTRGSIIANLVVDKILGNIQSNETVPKYSFNISDNVKDVFKFIEGSTFKQCFLPERFPSSKTERNPIIENILQTHQNDLNVLLPDWKSVMCSSGWDNAINRMESKYFANIMNHVAVHLKDYLKMYFSKLQIDTETPRDDIFNWFIRPVRPLAVSNDDFEFIMNLREYLGTTDPSDYITSSFECKLETFDLMMFLVKQGVTKGSYLPVSTLGRKYCYLDAKISRFLIPKLFKAKTQMLGREPSLMEMFDITPEAYRRRRRNLRRLLRARYKNKGSKLRKKWARLGSSNMPKDATIASFETDGVGVSLCIQIKLPLFEVPKKDDVLEKPVFVGVDIGRAKLFTAAISDCPCKKPTSYSYTRKEYYYDNKHKIRTRYERERSSIPEIKAALLDLSLEGGKKNMVRYLNGVATHYEVLKSEYLDNTDRALWAMRLYRLKKRALDKAVQQVVGTSRRDMVIGIGDARIAPTGRGEKAMPTNQIIKTFLKAQRKDTTRKIKLLGVNEFRTTLCCCACGQVTTPKILANGKRSGRLRLCTHCNLEDIKLRDRDVQAARNILWLTQYQYYGCDRPEYLSRPKRVQTTS